MITSANQLLELAAKIGARIVSSNDLDEFQIAESRQLGRFFVDENSCGWAVLPWSLTTSRDRDREREYFSQFATIEEA